MIRRLASLHWLQRGEVRQLQWYYQDAMTPCSHPAALRFLRLAVPRMHSLLSLPGGRVRRQDLELVTRYLQPGCRRGANRVLPSSWGITIVRLHMFHPTPAGLLARDHHSAAAWPLDAQVQRLPRWGLSTLNSMAFGLAVYASQCGLLQHHARLASSCWSGSTGRAFHPHDSAERFQSCRLHLILLSQASWRNGRDMSAQGAFLSEPCGDLPPGDGSRRVRSLKLPSHSKFREVVEMEVDDASEK